MDKLVKELMNEGMNINDIMSMPYTFVVDILEEKSQAKKEKTLFEAFGGG